MQGQDAAAGELRDGQVGRRRDGHPQGDQVNKLGGVVGGRLYRLWLKSA